MQEKLRKDKDFQLVKLKLSENNEHLLNNLFCHQATVVTDMLHSESPLVRDYLIKKVNQFIKTNHEEIIMNEKEEGEIEREIWLSNIPDPTEEMINDYENIRGQ